MKNKFKNYIFDFGQVIVKFDTAYMTSVYIKDEAEAKMAEKIIFDRYYWDKLDAGTITDDEVKKGICERLPKELCTDACKVYDNWYKILEFIDGIPEFIREIKANDGKLYLLSNISETFAKNYATVPTLRKILSMFDGLAFSAPLKITKPNKEIFEYVLNEYGLNPEETVFIDDREDNILGAQKAGINGYLFDGKINELRNYLFG